MVARGGQVLLSHATHAVVGDRLPGAVELRGLGVRRLPDLGPPERVHLLMQPELPPQLAALRSLEM